MLDTFNSRPLDGDVNLIQDVSAAEDQRDGDKNSTDCVHNDSSLTSSVFEIEKLPELITTPTVKGDGALLKPLHDILHSRPAPLLPFAGGSLGPIQLLGDLVDGLLFLPQTMNELQNGKLAGVGRDAPLKVAKPIVRQGVLLAAALPIRGGLGDALPQLHTGLFQIRTDLAFRAS